MRKLKLQEGGLLQNGGSSFMPKTSSLFNDYSNLGGNGIQNTLNSGKLFGGLEAKNIASGVLSNMPKLKGLDDMMGIGKQLFTKGGGGIGGAFKGLSSALGVTPTGLISTGLDTALGFMKDPARAKNSNTGKATSLRDSINSGLMSSGNPWAMAAGATNKLIDKLGGSADTSKGLGKSTDTLNMISSLAMPGAGWFTGKTQDYTKSDELTNSTGYAGSNIKSDTAAGNAGAKLLFGKSTANAQITNAKLADGQVKGIVNEAKDRFNSAGNQMFGTRNQMAMSGGYKPLAVGKDGMKLINIDKVRNTLNFKRIIPEFKDGGKVNLIPEGALHAHKNNLELDVTNKGIPVITCEDGGEITQHAEIERDEIIFHLEVSEQLEKLAADGSDNAAIEAGKLLVHEILENTDDRTGLLNTVEV